ncbi:MAG TPA: vWA domain-containing protein, partial [Planctomycetaceae bacterium]
MFSFLDDIKLKPPVPFETVLWLAAAALAVLLVLRLVAGPPAAISRRVGLYILRAALVATILAILLNPVHVEELPGSIDAPDVFYLLDSSTSMAMGTSESRWDSITRMIREAQQKAGNRSHARLNLFRFGQKLAAIEPIQIGLGQIGLDQQGGPAARTAGPASNKAKPAARPTDTDTQLAGGLRQLSSRFGRSLPASIVLFSDGQARDAADVEKTAGYFAKLAVPIHVVPVGDTGKGGDVAIVGVVAPDLVRRFAQVDMQIFLRSFGYEGRNAKLVLSALADNGSVDHEVTSTPITLRKGIQSVPLTFQSDPKMRKLRVSIKPQEDEISEANNHFDTEIAIDRTKIRVLYVEGNVTRLQTVIRNG